MPGAEGVGRGLQQMKIRYDFPLYPYLGLPACGVAASLVASLSSLVNAGRVGS